MRKCPIYILFFTLLLPEMSFGQQLLSLSDCIKAGKRNSLAYQQTTIDRQLERAKLEFAQKDVLPTIEAFASPTLSLGRSIDPTTNQFASKGFLNNVLGLSFSQILYAGGRKNTTIQQQSVQEKIAGLQIEKVENQLIVQIIQSYFQILLTKAVIKQTEKQLAFILENRAKSSQADLLYLQYQAQAANKELALIQAKNELRIQKITLGNLIGAPDPEFFDIQDLTNEQLNKPIQTQIDPRIFQQYYAWHPDYKISQMRQKNQSLQRDAIVASRFPTVSFSAGFTLPYSSLYQQIESSQLTRIDTIPVFFRGAIQPALNPVFDFTYRTIPMLSQWSQLANAYIGFQIRIPIMSGNSHKLQLKQSQHDILVTQLQAQQVKNDLIKESILAQSNRQAALSQYIATKSTFDVWQAYYQNALTSYQNNQLSAKDFQDIIQNYLQTELAVVKAQYEYFLWQELMPYYETGRFNYR